MSNSFYHGRYCLTKRQEEVIAPLLPAPKAKGRPSLNSLTVFNAILWILSSRALWRDLPPHKVHQHATGALKKHGNQAIGVSRGGKTTKIHALVTENFQLIGLLLTGGNIHDSECATELLSKVNLEGKTVLGDKAFCSERIRDFIQTQKAQVCIPDKVNSVVRHNFDCELYKARNVVERFFLR